jgi:hypothetical protein
VARALARNALTRRGWNEQVCVDRVTQSCMEAGDFAIEPLADASAIGRLFRFRITGGKQGQHCSGSDVDVDLRGCFYRTTTSLP